MLNEILPNYLPQDQFLNSFAIFGILILISIIAFYITEKIIFNLLAKMFRKTSTDIDDILVNRKLDTIARQYMSELRSKAIIDIRI